MPSMTSGELHFPKSDTTPTNWMDLLNEVILFKA